MGARRNAARSRRSSSIRETHSATLHFYQAIVVFQGIDPRAPVHPPVMEPTPAATTTQTDPSGTHRPPTCRRAGAVNPCHCDVGHTVTADTVEPYPPAGPSLLV